MVSLTSEEATQMLIAAQQSWKLSGLLSGSQLAGLKGLEIVLVDLQGPTLAEVNGDSIFIDITAAGYGWFVDETPLHNEESELKTDANLLSAEKGSDAWDRIDLLSVLLHELGHVAGLDHDIEHTVLAPIMAENLDPGSRYMMPVALSSFVIRSKAPFWESGYGFHVSLPTIWPVSWTLFEWWLPRIN